LQILGLVFALLITGVVSQSDFMATGAALQTATLMPNKTSGPAPLLVNFNIQVDPPSNGRCAQESWVLGFGDGASDQGTGNDNLNHVYNSPGAYEATLVLYARGERQ